MSASTAAYDAELLAVLKRELGPHGVRCEVRLRVIGSRGDARPGQTHLPTELLVFGADGTERAAAVVAEMDEGTFYCVTSDDKPWIRFPLRQVVEAAAYLRLLAWDCGRPPGTG
ncbi:hypothetical protein ABGB17_29000 [Sphaerisporangium sp. B11E5]|uniref:hypothetical protein n=1 Tax=Sphaerisporangium sp. B11E5 TaxID=3153563 RepID=UPI00325C4239